MDQFLPRRARTWILDRHRATWGGGCTIIAIYSLVQFSGLIQYRANRRTYYRCPLR